MNTIFALSSGALPAAIAVIRISGEQAFAALQQMCGDLPAPRRAAVRTLRRPRDSEVLDQALILCFPGPGSATGEDLVELHLHGGRAIVGAVEAVLAAMPGLRMAEPGEFTRRALLNGRLDLSEAEGLGDLLMAETESQRRVAIRSAGGAVRRLAESWTERLVSIAAWIEAVLDHGDEDDVGTEEPLPALRAQAAVLADDIAEHAARPPVERLRDGLRVVLAGPPNAGKSTLLNAMAERDAAIVSAIAGTTRDRIEVPVTRGGIAWVLTDTAGLVSDTDDVIEAIGVDRARVAIDEADILLWLGEDGPPEHPAVIWLKSRVDRLPAGATVECGRLAVSAVTGVGLDSLWERMGELASEMLPPVDLVGLNQRQRDLGNAAAAALRRASMLDDSLLFAEEVRSARRAVDAITGRAGIEDVLDSLFGRFCIGK
ncbi:tRNA uridine-5-carboxymethylaminomethyl(34) synthesis GTPase MnmE [Sphingomonas sp. RS6]